MNENNVIENVKPFVKNPIEPEALNGFYYYELRKRLNEGGALSEAERKTLSEKVFMEGTCVKYRGWQIDFSDVLKRFFVKRYNHAEINYAFCREDVIYILKKYLEFADSEDDYDDGDWVTITEVKESDSLYLSDY